MKSFLEMYKIPELNCIDGNILAIGFLKSDKSNQAYQDFTIKWMTLFDDWKSGKIPDNNEYIFETIKNYLLETLLRYKKYISVEDWTIIQSITAIDNLITVNNKQDIDIEYVDGKKFTIENGVYSATGNSKLDYDELRKYIAKGALIGIRELKSFISKNPKYSKRGKVIEDLDERVVYKDYTITTEQLTNFLESAELYSCFNAKEIRELINQKYLSKWNVIKAMSNKNITEPKVLELMQLGVLTKEEVLKKYYHATTFGELGKKPKTSIDTKLMLYALGELPIKSIETPEEQLEREKLKEETMAFLGANLDSNKIGELLTHNVLNYDESISFLSFLVEHKHIAQEQSDYYEKLMSDFKTNQLLNISQVEELGYTGQKTGETHKAGVAIDPNLRIKYLKSIGSVKRIIIKGKKMLSDQTGRERKNTIDGYELLILPEKRIGILEKFYESTRSASNDIGYKHNKKGELIPAISNATYIIPIGLAKELAENKNKQELLRLPYVRRCFHTANWVNMLESRIKEVSPEIEFDKQNTDIWAKKISENYRTNRGNDRTEK